MAEYIEREAFLADKKWLYCTDCDKRKGKKRGKMVTLYEIGEAPCKSCGIHDMLEEVEDYPAADVRPVVRWTLCEDKQPPTGRYLVLKKYFGGDFGYDVCSYAEDLSKIDKYDFPKRQYKGIGGWFDYDSETGYFQTSVYAWMPLPTAPWFGAKMEEN